jgi:predicted N-acetyltransferase YhbS
MTTYRIASPDDLPALRAIVERAYRGDSARQGWTHEADFFDDARTSDAELAEALADPARRVLLTEQDGALIGTVTITDCGNGLAYLGMLCVDPAIQAGGLGRWLIAEAEALAVRDFGARSMEMTVIGERADLIAYYERRGYARTGEARPFPYSDPTRFAMVVLARAIS